MSVPSYHDDPLDVPLKLEDEEYRFHEKATGLQLDSDDPSTSLKHHLYDVQAKAHKVHPYPCVRRWNFARFKVKRNSLAYDHVLAEGKNDKSVIFIDAGCCMGTDVRTVVADGFPADQILGTDLDGRFIELGYELFRDSPSSPHTPAFLVGDLFSSSFLDPTTSPSSSPPPSLKSLKSLTPLINQVRHIHCGSLFHLFGEKTQLQLARQLFPLLRPAAGSTIFGSHLGREEAGPRDRNTSPWRKHELDVEPAWSHSSESWEQVWNDLAREKGLKVEVESFLESRGDYKAMPSISGTDKDGADSIKILVWCVKIIE